MGTDKSADINIGGGVDIFTFRRPRRGLFLTLEGGEGAGKSTQAKRLEDALRERGHQVLRTREPGGTKGAEALRDLLLFGKADLTWQAQALAHTAARLDYLERVILPALAEGKTVICDRFTDSTQAYQGYGLGLAETHPEAKQFLQELNQLLPQAPDMTFLLDLPLSESRDRLLKRQSQNQAPVQKQDAYETQELAFHARARRGFLEIAKEHPRRVTVIDATQSPEDVTWAILGAMRAREDSLAARTT